MNGSYTAFVDSEPEKYLRRLDRPTRDRVNDEIDRLEVDRYHRGVEPIKGRPGFDRSRVGGYRVIYAVNDAVREITIVDIGARGDVYK